METVMIDGVEYVRAAVLARQHGYTADYIGQLCRGNKVDAHLVGRTWYVYPPSLDNHKSTRYSELRSNDKSKNEDSKIMISRRVVNPPPAKRTSKTLSANFAHRVFWRDHEYQDDDSELLPALRKPTAEKVPTAMKIGLADSRRVSIVGRSEKVTMVSEPPPAIALAGTLKVRAYEPHFSTLDEFSESDKNIDKSSHIDSKLAVRTIENVTEEAEPVPVRRVAKEVEFPVYDVPLKKQVIEHAPLSFSPKIVRSERKSAAQVEKGVELPKKQSLSVTVAEDPAHSLFFNLVIAPAMVLLVVMVAGSFFFLESLTEVNARGEQVRVFSLSASSWESIFGAERTSSY